MYVGCIIHTLLTVRVYTVDLNYIIGERERANLVVQCSPKMHCIALVMNSTKVQNPRRKMQVALLAEPKTPPGVEHVYIIL